jgi:hypothetical protein
MTFIITRIEVKDKEEKKRPLSFSFFGVKFWASIFFFCKNLFFYFKFSLKKHKNVFLRLKLVQVVRIRKFNNIINFPIGIDLHYNVRILK